MNKEISHVNIIGGGYAGIECGLYLASKGVRVHLFSDMQNYDMSFGENDDFATEILSQELEILGSRLLYPWRQTGGEHSEVIRYGLKLLKASEYVDLFDLSVYELNPKEVNIICTGPHSEIRLCEYLRDKFSSFRFHDVYPVYAKLPLDIEEKLTCEGGKYFLPLDYQKYIDFCNSILKEKYEHNMQVQEKYKPHVIEEVVSQGRDALKSYCMNPSVTCSERPYAALYFKKKHDGFEAVGICSKFDYESQTRIFQSVLPDVKLIANGYPCDYTYITPKLTLNEFFQSQKQDNLFFAGGMIGIKSELGAMASGLYVARNVIAYLKCKNMLPLKEKMASKALFDKLFNQNALKFCLAEASYDIIKIANSQQRNAVKRHLLSLSKDATKSYEEEFNARIIQSNNNLRG